jgi:hypothetical protein
MGEEREMTMEGEYIWRDANTGPMTTGQEATMEREWDRNSFFLPYKRLSPSPSDPALRFMRSQQDDDCDC